LDSVDNIASSLTSSFCSQPEFLFTLLPVYNESVGVYFEKDTRITPIYITGIQPV